MNKNKRLLSFVLALVMVLGMFPLNVIAADESSSVEIIHNETCVEGCADESCVCACHQVAIVTDDAEQLCDTCNATMTAENAIKHESTCEKLLYVAPVCTGDPATCEIENCVCKQPVVPVCTGDPATCEIENCACKQPAAPVCTGDPATCEIENCACKQPADPEKTFAEGLLEIDNLSDLLIAVCDENNLDALLALTAEEITALRARANELYAAIEEPTEQDGWDLDDFLATTEMLPSYRAENACPDCGVVGEHAEDCPWLHMAVMPADGKISETTISTNTVWNLTRDVTLLGTVTIKSGAKLGIFNHDKPNNGATRTIKRAGSFTGVMFKVEDGGSLQINGAEWNNATWDAGNPTKGPVVIDGNSEVTATGAIIECSGKLALRDSVIRNNKGYRAIWLKGSGGGDRYDNAHNRVVDIEITRTSIEKCSAVDGAGIYIAHNTPAGYTVDIWQSRIYQCTAIDASAIYFASSGQAEVTMRNSVVDDCDTTTGGDGQYGGALRTNGNGRFKFTMTDSILRNCDSWKFGGGVYWNAAGTGAMLTIEDCQFLNNTAKEMGGAMFLEGSNMTIKASTGTPTAAITSGAMPGDIVGTLIENNYAPNGGGISYKCYSNSIEVQIPTTVANFNENVIFNNNKATNGAALAYNLHNTHNYPTDSTFTFNINGAKFTNNESDGKGGAIYVEKCREDYKLTVNFNSGTITNNSAKNGGAIAITVASGVTTGGTFNMKGGTLANNTATDNGGGVYLQKGNFNMSGGTVQENNSQNGGSAYITGGNFTMSNGTMKQNTATTNGGAVYVNSGNFTISNGVIENNTAIDGGAAYVNNGNFVMSGGKIQNNNASHDGGAAYITGGSMTMSDGLLQDNTAVRHGGALYVSGGDFTMTSGKMLSNKANSAESYGGGAYVNGGNVVIGVENCKGGPIDDKHNVSPTNKIHPVIMDNEATLCGGGLAVMGDGNVTMHCGNIITNHNGNENRGRGLNIYMQGGTFEYYQGGNVGSTTEPELVIVGGELNDHHVTDPNKKTNLVYHHCNDDPCDHPVMSASATTDSYINLPDGEFYWDAATGYKFFGWTFYGPNAENAPENVRAKEDYKAMGLPIKVEDMLDGADNTPDAINMYALWAPINNKITHKGIIVDDNGTVEEITGYADGTNPNGYTLNEAPSTINLTDPVKPGYEFHGWHVFQDSGKNANWTSGTDSFEPVHKVAGKNDAISNLDFFAAKKMHFVEPGADLAVPAMTFGDITFVAEYEELKVTINYEIVGPNSECATLSRYTEGTIGMATGTVEGSTVALANNNYRFVGWYADSECTIPVGSEMEYIPARNVETGLWETATYYAKVEWNLTDMKISKTVSGDIYDSDDTFRFQVVDTESDAVIANVTLQDGDFVIIKDVIVGKTYAVTELNSGNRYTVVGDATKNVDIKPPAADGSMSPENVANFTNTANEKYWLSATAIVKNTFGNGSFIEKIFGN